jgi:signal transduction histidine kinase
MVAATNAPGHARRRKTREPGPSAHGRRRTDLPGAGLPIADGLLRARCSDAQSVALVEAAHDRAAQLVSHDPALACASFAADACTSLLLEGRLPHADVPQLVADLASHARVDPVALGLRALRDPRLLRLPLEASLEIALLLLEAVAPVAAPSVWTLRDPTGPRLMQWRSELPPDGLRHLVDAATKDGTRAQDGAWTALVLKGFERRVAVLVLRVECGAAGVAGALAAALATLLDRAFERAALIASAADGTGAVARADAARVTRMALDLHDGPLQDLVVLTQGLGGLRRAVATCGLDGPAVAGVLERIEDLEGFVTHLDGDLRDVANSLYAADELRRPFVDALGALVRAFAARCDIEPHVTLAGELDGLPDATRGTLLRIVQESLGNVREHSGAREVWIAIACTSTRVEAVIEDDGDGFDAADALHQAARRGRLGLLGIVERVRLLGGTCDVTSQPGEGCRITLNFARWDAATCPDRRTTPRA